MKNEIIKNFNNNNVIINVNGEVYFLSYYSTIATIKNDKLTLFSKWDYSTTTKKYLYKFIEYYNILDLENVKNKTNYINKLINENKINYVEESKIKKEIKKNEEILFKNF